MSLSTGDQPVVSIYGRSAPPNLELFQKNAVEGAPCLPFRHAALLSLLKAGGPLGPTAIATTSLNNGWIVTTGKTPQNTIAAQLYTEMGKHPDSPFFKAGPGLFGLKSYDEKEVMAKYFHPASSGVMKAWKPKYVETDKPLKRKKPDSHEVLKPRSQNKKHTHPTTTIDEKLLRNSQSSFKNPKKKVRFTVEDHSGWFSDSGFSSSDEESDEDTPAISKIQPERYFDIPSFEGTNFVWAKEIPFSELTQELVEDYVIKQGLPLVCRNVIQNWSDWNRQDWSFGWLQTNFGKTKLLNGPRDIDRMQDLPNWSLSQYIDYLVCPDSEKKYRLYGKDVTAPPEWRSYLFDHLPPYLTWKHHGDLLGEPSRNMQAESLMIYIGHENTRTPAHKDICGTIGHNLLVYAEPTEGGQKGGAVWYCAGRHEDSRVGQFWAERQRSIDADNYFMPVDELKKAPFPVHVIDQAEGDLVIVPPEAAHQVVNKGRSCKFAWNRLNVSILENTVNRVLPLYRALRKPEVYRVRLATLCGLQNWLSQILVTFAQIDSLSDQNSSPDLVETVQKYLREVPILISVIEKTLTNDYLPSDSPQNLDASTLPYLLRTSPVIRFTDPVPHKRWCNICSADILNRCLHGRIEFTSEEITTAAQSLSNQPGSEPLTFLCSDDEEEDLEIDICFECAVEAGEASRLKKEYKFRVTEYYDYNHYYQIICDSYSRLRDLYSWLKKSQNFTDPSEFQNLSSLPLEKEGMLSYVRARVERPELSAAIKALRVLEPLKICHQCHGKFTDGTSVEQEMLSCVSCPRAYCFNCLMIEYDFQVTSDSEKETWKCFYCRNSCMCVLCSSMKKPKHTITSKSAKPKVHTSQLYNSFFDIESKLLRQWSDEGPQELVAPQFVV